MHYVKFIQLQTLFIASMRAFKTVLMLLFSFQFLIHQNYVALIWLKKFRNHGKKMIISKKIEIEHIRTIRTMRESAIKY